MDIDRWLEQSYGREVMRPGLERVAAFLQNHKTAAPAANILVVGTNGKGSVATALAQYLSAAGERTLLFTSPHLLTVRERVRIDSAQLDEAAWMTVGKIIESADISYFEAVFCMAVLLGKGCDTGVWEAGLGGRYDAVNALDNVELIVLTGIGHDHLEILGGTLERALAEKLSVVRRNVPVVVGPLPDRLQQLAGQMIGRRRGVYLPADATLPARWEKVVQRLRAGHPVPASHARTLAWALQTLDRLPPDDLPSFDPLPCRWQKIGKLIVDVGHNREAAAFAAEQIGAQKRRLQVTLALRTRKDAAAVIRELAVVDHLVSSWELPDLGTEFYPPSQLAELLRAGGVSGAIETSFDLQCIHTEEDRLVFGSFVLAGKVLAASNAHEAV